MQLQMFCFKWASDINIKKMTVTLLLTATIKPGDVIYCDRRDVDRRLQDYLFAFRFWIGESSVDNIVFVENSGFELVAFKEVIKKYNNKNKKIELLSFQQLPFDKNLGKSYGEAKIIEYAIEHSALLSEDTFIIKGTGRYYATNFFRVWPIIQRTGYPDVLANFYNYPSVADSRYFGARKEFLKRYFLAAAAEINDSTGHSFETALGSAVQAAITDGYSWRQFPGGGLLVDGVQASTNTVYPYPTWRRLLYRAVATFRNGLPFQLRLGAPVHKPGQGSQS